MTLEAAYWIALGAGLGFLVLALLLGDVFDLFDIELGGSDLAAGPIFFATVAAFGAGGLLGIKAFEFGTGGSIYVGLGTGLSMGALTGLLFSALRRQEAGDGFELAKLIGARGRCSVAIHPGQVGRVIVPYGGMSRSLSARSSDEIAVGDEVVVKDVVGNTITVSRADATSNA
ncbi:MAG TPA: NfeD family protein [Actinomycetota bacterium]